MFNACHSHQLHLTLVYPRAIYGVTTVWAAKQIRSFECFLFLVCHRRMRNAILQNARSPRMSRVACTTNVNALLFAIYFQCRLCVTIWQPCCELFWLSKLLQCHNLLLSCFSGQIWTWLFLQIWSHILLVCSETW